MQRRGPAGRALLTQTSPPTLRCTASSRTRCSTRLDRATLRQLPSALYAAADESPREYVTQSLTGSLSVASISMYPAAGQSQKQ